MQFGCQALIVGTEIGKLLPFPILILAILNLDFKYERKVPFWIEGDRSQFKEKADSHKTGTGFFFEMAERMGFEPMMEYNPHTRLAGERLQPARPSLPVLVK